jgi:hypothetical protein
MGLVSGLVALRWRGGCAPYTFSENQLDPDEIEKVEAAVRLINDTGFVRLIKRTTQTRYIDKAASGLLRLHSPTAPWDP